MGSHSLDAKLRAEATAFAACARSYAAAADDDEDDDGGGGTGSAGGGGVGGMPAQVWHECVAVACGFHACVVGQSLYAPQLRGWFGSFSARQFAVLALDEFALQPQAVLRRVASFLGVAPFPRMVLEWNWQWNQLTQPPGKQLAAAAAAAAATAAAAAARAPVLAELRAFYAPYNAALAALLRKRGQAHTARYVESWRENAPTAKLPTTTAERE